MTSIVITDPPATESSPPASMRKERSRRPLAVGALLIGTAVLYLWGLGSAGNANSFYAAAVQAGTKSWKAFFFGSLDSSNFITVDKPPVSLWPMELAGRLFGVNSWSMLVPQALMGVGAVWLLYLTVRRWFGHSAGMIAGALLAVTPVAVLMFRYNQPDALMTLLLVLAAYAVTRAIDDGRLRWLLVAGAAMGVDFLTKGLQPFTVLPALALVYLVAAETTLGRRIRNLLLAGVMVVVSAGWWVLVVAIWPVSSRPYIGGSTDNSALGLAFGYNGLTRLTGENGGGGPGGGGPGGGGGFGGSTGLGRLFNSQMGTQISWLLPAALVALVALIAFAGRAPRTDRTRAVALLWGAWLLVTGAVFSYAGGIIHPYYTVQLAPAIAALVAVGAVVSWRRRSEAVARLALALGIGLTAVWSYQLLDRSPSWQPWLRYALFVVAASALVGLLLPTWRRSVAVAGLAGLVVVAGGSAAYAVDTAASAQSGSTPSAGPVSASGGGFGGFRGFASGVPNSTRNGFPGGGQFSSGGQLPFGVPSPSSGGATSGGTSGAESANAQLAALLEASTTRWAAAVVGDQAAATLELASNGAPVMAIGGWSGSDPAPTLAQFQAYVAAGKIHYFVAGTGVGVGGGGAGLGGAAGFGGAAGSGTGNAIATWVAAHYTATTVGGQSVYDLTTSASS